MNYRQKRNKNKLSTYQVSKLLGIDEKTYIEVEKGYRNLEGDMLQKWQDIMDNSKGIRLENMQKERDIDDMIKSGKVKKDLKELGYTQTELSKKLGISLGGLNKALKQPEKSNFDYKLRIVDFVENPLNKKIEWKNKPGHIEPIDIEHYVKTTEYLINNLDNQIKSENETDNLIDEINNFEEEKQPENDLLKENSDLRHQLDELRKDYDSDMYYMKILEENKQKLEKQLERYEKLIDLL